VVKKNGPPHRAVILLKFKIVSSFKEWSVLEVGVGQSFPQEMVRIVISSGNGPDSHFLRKWFGQSFPRANSFSQGCTMISVERIAQLGEWSRFNNQGHAFPRENSFCPGYTMISAIGMAQYDEWSRLIN
jgi:hypothetical protein